MSEPLPAELRLAIDAASERLGAFADLRYAETIGSTNDAALALAAAGAREGTSVLADRQTEGRGRRGRSWSSPAGAGLYLSVILRGAHFTSAPGLATLGAGVAAATAVRVTTGLPAQLKWPNDLVIGDRWRKLGGILCEAADDAVVIGVGINITPAAHPPDVRDRAASIEGELNRGIDRAALVVQCLVGLRQLARDIAAGRGETVLADWKRLAAEGWQASRVSWPGGEGIARDLDHDGALIVERDGRRERVIAGEVTWQRRA